MTRFIVLAGVTAVALWIATFYFVNRTHPTEDFISSWNESVDDSNIVFSMMKEESDFYYVIKSWDNDFKIYAVEKEKVVIEYPRELAPIDGERSLNLRAPNVRVLITGT